MGLMPLRNGILSRVAVLLWRKYYTQGLALQSSLGVKSFNSWRWQLSWSREKGAWWRLVRRLRQLGDTRCEFCSIKATKNVAFALRERYG